MRRPLYSDESLLLFDSLREQSTKSPRPVLTVEEANRWHASQGARQRRERERLNHYLYGNSKTSKPFPGDQP